MKKVGTYLSHIQPCAPSVLDPTAHPSMAALPVLPSPAQCKLSAPLAASPPLHSHLQEGWGTGDSAIPCPTSAHHRGVWAAPAPPSWE